MKGKRTFGFFGHTGRQASLWYLPARWRDTTNHQGKDNVLLFPTSSQDTVRAGLLQCRERLGGLLKYYECEAA
jgi:putative transposase